MTTPAARFGHDVVFEEVYASDLSRHRTLNGGVATLGPALTLNASAPAWSYVLLLDVPSCEDGLYVAEVTGRVVSGKIMLGTLLADRKTIRDERLVEAGENGPWYIVAGRLRECHCLLARTILPQPQEATLEIESVKWLRTHLDCESLWSTVHRTDLVPVPDWGSYYGHHGTLIERLRSCCYEHLDFPREMAWLFGLRVIVQPRDQMSRAVFVSGLYEPATMLALRRLIKANDVVIDAGANVGFVSLVCSVWVGTSGRILAFEPSSREYARLLDHLRLNGASNVEPHLTALASEPGDRLLQVADSYHSGLNTLGSRPAYDGVGVQEREIVETTTIDAVVEAAHLARVDVIKLDVEGAEHDVILGAAHTIRRFAPAMVFEANAAALAASDRTPLQLGHLIASQGYRLFAITDGGYLRAVRQLVDEGDSFVALVPNRIPAEVFP